MTSSKMLDYLPGITADTKRVAAIKKTLGVSDDRQRLQLVRLGILYHASRQSLTAEQLSLKMGVSKNLAQKELTRLISDGRVVVIDTVTVSYDLPSRGRKNHVVRVYRTKR